MTTTPNEGEKEKKLESNQGSSEAPKPSADVQKNAEKIREQVREELSLEFDVGDDDLDFGDSTIRLDDDDISLDSPEEFDKEETVEKPTTEKDSNEDEMLRDDSTELDDTDSLVLELPDDDEALDLLTLDPADEEPDPVVPDPAPVAPAAPTTTPTVAPTASTTPSAAPATPVAPTASPVAPSATPVAPVAPTAAPTASSAPTASPVAPSSAPAIPLHTERTSGIATKPDKTRTLVADHVIPALKSAGVGAVAYGAFLGLDSVMSWSQILAATGIEPVALPGLLAARYSPALASFFPAIGRMKPFEWLKNKLPKKVLEYLQISPKPKLQEIQKMLTTAFTGLPGADQVSFGEKKAHSLEEGNIDRAVEKLVQDRATKLNLTPASVPNFTKVEADTTKSLEMYAEYCLYQMTKGLTQTEETPVAATGTSPASVTTTYLHTLDSYQNASWELARAIQCSHMRKARVQSTIVGLGASAGAYLTIGLAPIVPILQVGAHAARWLWNRKPAPDVQFSLDKHGNEVALPVGVIRQVKYGIRKSPTNGKLYTEGLLEKANSLVAKDGSAVAYYLNHDALKAPETILKDGSIRDIFNVAEELESQILEELVGKSAFVPKPDPDKLARQTREYTEAQTALKEKKAEIESLKTQLKTAQRNMNSAIATLKIPGFGSSHPQYASVTQMEEDAKQIIDELLGAQDSTTKIRSGGEIARKEKELKNTNTGEQTAFKKAKAALQKLKNPPAMKIVDKTKSEIATETAQCKQDFKTAMDELKMSNTSEKKAAVKEAKEKLDEAEAQISISDDAIRHAFAIRCDQILKEIKKKKEGSFSGRTKTSLTKIALGCTTVAAGAGAIIVAPPLVATALTGVWWHGYIVTGLALWGVSKVVGITKPILDTTRALYRFGIGQDLQRSSTSPAAAAITKPVDHSTTTTGHP